MISYKIHRIGKTLKTKQSSHLNEYLPKEVASCGKKITRTQMRKEKV